MTDHIWPDGVARHVLVRCDSTNAEALRLAPGLTGSAWVMAREQTRGRGRRGREWVSDPCNFAASLVLHPQGPVDRIAQLSFVAALALYDVLAAVCGPAARLAIKWPNDVLLNGGKVAGILLESSGQGNRVEALAVGIGVNLATAPAAARIETEALPAVSVLNETGMSVSPDDFLDLIAPTFALWQARLMDEGFAPIRQAWTARAARIGQNITARTGRDQLLGRLEEIDENGALILITAAGRRIIPAADIYFED